MRYGNTYLESGSWVRRAFVPVNLVDEFRASHARIEGALTAAERVTGEPLKLLEQLRAVRGEVLAHFKAKDAFYPSLAEQCLRAKDAGAAQLTRIFESNMKVQSGAVQRFFEGLDSVNPATVVSSFRTVTTVIRQRFGTEERAVFPIYLRTRPPEAA